MKYNDLIESCNNELFDVIKSMFELTVNGNSIRVKQVTVAQPTMSPNYCMSLNKTYGYTVNFVVECYEGDFKGQTTSVSFELPKMVENNFLMHTGGYRAKYKTPFTIGLFHQCIRGDEGAVLSDQFRMFLDPLETKHGVRLPELCIYGGSEDGNLVYELSSYLLSNGVDYDKVHKYIPFGKEEQIGETSKVVIADFRWEKFRKKYFQLTGREITSPELSGDDLMELVIANREHPELFDKYSPFDVDFLSDYDVLVKDMWAARREVMQKLTYFISDNFKRGKFKIPITTLTRKIARHYQAKSEFYQTIQPSSESNAATSESQSHKIHFVYKPKDSKKYIQMPLQYTDDFIGVVCPFKSPEGNNINLKNELARHVEIADKKAFIKVRDKSGTIHTLEYFDYFKSKILSRTNYDYRERRVVPTDGTITYLYRGEYVTEKYESDDQFDYVRVDEVSMLAYNTSLVPFGNCNDSVRIAMSTNMLDQAIPINGGGRVPVMTGTESEIYDRSDFNIRAGFAGKVLDIYEDYIKLQRDDNGEIEYFKVPDPMFTADHTFNRHRIAVKPGDIVTPKTVLAESNSFKDGLLATKVPAHVLYMNYHGYEHEDGIIMRRGFLQNFLHTMDTVVDIFIPNSTRSKFDRDFLIKKCKENGIRLDSISEIEKLNEFGLPNVGDKVNGGGILAAFIEELDPNSSVLARLNKLSSKSQLSRASVRKVPYSVMDGVITRIDVTINPKANYLDKIRTHYEEQVRKEDAKLREFLGDREVVRNIDVDFNRFSGVIRIYIRYEDVPEVGDKFSNLFGSKGTITKILEDDEMPLSKATGLPYDAIFGPDSTWSRKNPSQVKEAYLGLAAVESKKLGTQYIADGEFGKLRELLNALHVTKKYNDYSDQELIDYDKSQDRFYVVYADFMDNKYTKEALERIEQVTGVSMENKEIVYIPEERTYSRIPIVHGYNSMLRLHFKAADKARATSAIYTGDDLVIGRGKYRGGGQQLGEMEIWSLLSNNTVEVYEHLTGRDVTTQSTQSIQNAMFLMGLVLQPDEVLSTGNSDSESEE